MPDLGCYLTVTSISGHPLSVTLQEVAKNGGERRKLSLQSSVFPRDIGEAWVIFISTLCALSSVIFSTSLHKGKVPYSQLT